MRLEAAIRKHRIRFDGICRLREDMAMVLARQKASVRRWSMWSVGVFEAAGAIVVMTLFAEDQAVPEAAPKKEGG
jgi:hypothetical protein